MDAWEQGMHALRHELKHLLSLRARETLHIEGFHQAAVLVPLIVAEGRLELLFTVRSQNLRKHAGEISFPGGRLDKGETIVQAAIRESWEEIGLKLSESQVLGFLDDRPSPAEYVVTPVLALLEKPQGFNINEHEVTEVFRAPLEDLRGLPTRVEERLVRGQLRKVHFYPLGEKLIWGLTGNIVKNVLDILYPLRNIGIK